MVILGGHMLEGNHYVPLVLANDTTTKTRGISYMKTDNGRKITSSMSMSIPKPIKRMSETMQKSTGS